MSLARVLRVNAKVYIMQSHVTNTGATSDCMFSCSVSRWSTVNFNNQSEVFQMFGFTVRRKLFSNQSLFFIILCHILCHKRNGSWFGVYRCIYICEVGRALLCFFFVFSQLPACINNLMKHVKGRTNYLIKDLQ